MINIYDNLISLDARSAMYNFILKSYFTIGYADSRQVEDTHVQYIASNYSEQDVEELGLLKYLKDTPVEEHYKCLTFARCMVNLDVPSNVHFVHTHGEYVGLLYYANLRWETSWAGETLFFNDDQDKVIAASVYKPGRVLVFDGMIPHTIRPQSIAGPQYRFTVAILFNKTTSGK